LKLMKTNMKKLEKGKKKNCGGDRGTNRNKDSMWVTKRQKKTDRPNKNDAKRFQMGTSKARPRKQF